MDMFLFMSLFPKSGGQQINPKLCNPKQKKAKSKHLPTRNKRHGLKGGWGYEGLTKKLTCLLFPESFEESPLLREGSKGARLLFEAESLEITRKQKQERREGREGWGGCVERSVGRYIFGESNDLFFSR
ncbi:hypothetical protein CEXT_41841 [Caerostris extrusa]|uniref:Uncharacterized protein n=1 Tax=Caerostris extrusa TaxID=172846 RepID=A0AAV4T6Z3_CAEEX|nr:hypothetical protein CEXT_41841 [Caerostris extrusa]